MLTLEDCIALSDLTLEEIDAIAEHEHLPVILAAELGSCLAHCAHGRGLVRAMIREDIEAARARGDYRRSAELKLVLQHFIQHCRGNSALAGVDANRGKAAVEAAYFSRT
jgi:hypothetical protein